MKNFAVRSLIILLLLTTASLAITACGQKGPLYLPDNTSNN